MLVVGLYLWRGPLCVTYFMLGRKTYFLFSPESLVYADIHYQTSLLLICVPLLSFVKFN